MLPTRLPVIQSLPRSPHLPPFLEGLSKHAYSWHFLFTLLDHLTCVSQIPQGSSLQLQPRSSGLTPYLTLGDLEQVPGNFIPRLSSLWCVGLKLTPHGKYHLRTETHFEDSRKGHACPDRHGMGLGRHGFKVTLPGVPRYFWLICGGWGCVSQRSL